MRPWIIAAILLAAAVTQAEDPSDMTFERLAKVHRFAFGGTGVRRGHFPREKGLQGYSVPPIRDGEL